MEVLESLQFVHGPQVVNGLAIGVAVILMALGLLLSEAALRLEHRFLRWRRVAE